tara:strand:- start:17940 stop:18671 length:732 start_codon:yes stop_codon:yes gene_type:complete
MAKFLQFIDGSDSAVSFPVERLISMSCTSDGEVSLRFAPSSVNTATSATDIGVDLVTLDITSNSEKAVLEAIGNAISFSPESVITVADNVKGKFLDLSIVQCNIFNPMIILLNDANQNLAHNTHQGKTSVVPAIGGNRTYTIPNPTRAGQHYKLVYGGAAVEAQNVLISTGTGNSVFMKGGVAWINSNATSDNGLPVLSDGNSNELLTLVTPGAFEVNLVSYSTTEWYVYGWVVSATVPTMGD